MTFNTLYSFDDRAVRFAEYMLDNNATVRAVAKRFGISKSTVHKDLTVRLKHTSPGLYSEVAAVMENNKQTRHLRGGNATKEKYAKIRDTEKNNNVKPKR